MPQLPTSQNQPLAKKHIETPESEYVIDFTLPHGRWYHLIVTGGPHISESV